MRAVDDYGVGNLTDAVSADIPAPPDPPTNLQATASDESVTLTWKAPEHTLTGYLVYRKVRDADPPEEFIAVGLAEGDATSYSDMLVEADTAYAYHVVSVNLVGESDPSAEVTVDTQANSLTGFTLVDASDQTVLATLTGGTSVELDDADGGSYGIRVEIDPDATIGSVSLELTGAETVSRTENLAPYSLHGDDKNGSLYGAALPAGSYNLTATAYAESNLGGNKLGTLEVSFTVTQANRAPEFGSATYNFSIAEDAVAGAAVGSVSATDADGDGLTYTIESGNVDGKFAIDGSTGAITTAGALDHDTNASYTLTVQADDGNGGTATATANVSVTDVEERSEEDEEKPSAGPLVSFTLVDASDQSALAILTDGSSVDLPDPSGGSYAIRVDVDTGISIGSVILELTGARSIPPKTENLAPYSLYGDDGEDALHGEALPAGSYTLRSTAYSERSGSGDVLGILEVSFTVTDGA